MVLANALCHNDHLTSLNIDGNTIGFLGSGKAKRIIIAVSRNYSLPIIYCLCCYGLVSVCMCLLVRVFMCVFVVACRLSNSGGCDAEVQG